MPFDEFAVSQSELDKHEFHSSSALISVRHFSQCRASEKLGGCLANQAFNCLGTTSGCACMLQVCLVVPWGLQFLFYTLLYRVFPRDRDASEGLERPRRQRSASQNDMLDLSGAADESQQYSPSDQDALQDGTGDQMNKRGVPGGRAAF